MRKAIAIIIALAAFAMFVAALFPMHAEFGAVGVIIVIVVYLIALSFFVNSGKVDEWLLP